MADWYSMPSNYSNGTVVDTVSEFFIKYPSFIVGNYLGLFLVIVMWSVLFTLGMISGVRKSLMVSSFITFLFSIFLVRLSELNMVVPIVLILLTIIGAIGSKEEGGY